MSYIDVYGGIFGALVYTVAIKIVVVIIFIFTTTTTIIIISVFIIITISILGTRSGNRRPQQAAATNNHWMPRSLLGGASLSEALHDLGEHLKYKKKREARWSQRGRKC